MRTMTLYGVHVTMKARSTARMVLVTFLSLTDDRLLLFLACVAVTLLGLQPKAGEAGSGTDTHTQLLASATQNGEP